MQSKKLVLVLAALAMITSASAQAGTLTYSSLSAVQKLKVRNFVNTEVRADVQNNLRETVLEAAKDPVVNVNDLSAPPPADKLTPETRAVILKGIYLSIRARGIPVNEATFDAQVGKILDYAQAMGVVPSALTMGWEIRAQEGIGASLGQQFNLYLQKGVLKMSNYNMYSVEAGFASSATMSYYISFCFGSCTGGAGSGYYIGMDGSISGGVGAGFFMEVGVDITDLMGALFHKKSYSIKELYQSKAVYAGFSFDVGVGGGVSLNLFHYDLFQDVELTNIGQKISPAVIQNIKLR